MRRMTLTLIAAAQLALLATAAPAAAQDKPVQLSLFTPIQIFPDDVGIKGFRLNLIYGRNTGMVGLDIGIANHTTSRELKGVQFGLVGIAAGDVFGWQDNIVNWSTANVTGLQWGFLNRAGHLHGLQLGIINYTESIQGLQIGLANVIREGGWLPFMIIVNGGF